MTSSISCPSQSADDRMLIAWEAPSSAGPDEWIEALEQTAQHLGQSVAGFAVAWDPACVAAFPRLVALAHRHGLGILPIIHLGQPGTDSAWRQTHLPNSLARLVAANAACEFDGVRYAVAIADGPIGVDEGLRDLRAALGAPGIEVRIGWRRSMSSYVATPTGFDFSVTWPPYDAGNRNPGESRRAIAYPLLVADLGKRRAGDGAVAPSIIWSATRATDLRDAGMRIVDFSPLMFGHAVDSARRFVRNRHKNGVPFWVLRAAFASSVPESKPLLRDLAQILSERHRSSATMGTVVGPIPVPARRARIAAVVHIYYPDLWDEIADTLSNLPEACDLFVSCPFRLLPALRRTIVERFPTATVFGVQNLGRDVLPFLLWLRAAGPDAYTYVLKLHGKKSVHIIDSGKTPFGGGDAWRRAAFDGLVADRAHAQRVLDALDAAPSIGLVAPAGQLYDQVRWECATGDLVATVLDRLGIVRNLQGGFPAGTMFWARVSALARFATLGEALLDFEREAGQVDGTLHHAYERLFALVAEHDGYRVTDSTLLLA